MSLHVSMVPPTTTRTRKMQVLFACQHLLVVFPCSHGHDGPSKGGTWGWTRTRGFSCTYDLASSRSLARRRPKYLQKLTCRCGHGHKDCVMQINGERVDVDVMPEMTIGDLKQKLKALQPSSDKVIRRITLVELLLEGRNRRRMSWPWVSWVFHWIRMCWCFSPLMPWSPLARSPLDGQQKSWWLCIFLKRSIKLNTMPSKNAACWSWWPCRVRFIRSVWRPLLAVCLWRG